MSEPLILYDIPNKHDGQLRAWSPNTWKTRCTRASFPHRSRSPDYCTFSTKSSSPVAQGRERTSSRVAQDQANKFRQILYA
jgi:hypothetical protein